MSLRTAQNQFGAVSIDPAPVDEKGGPAMSAFPLGLRFGVLFGSTGIGFGREQMHARVGIIPAMVVIRDRRDC